MSSYKKTRKVKGDIMKAYVEVDFRGNDAICTINIIPAVYRRDIYIKIVIENDATFTINEAHDIGNLQYINSKGFADLLEFCKTLDILKRTMPSEMFLAKVLSNEYTNRLINILSTLADTNYIHIIGLKNKSGCDYINVDVVRNNDKTLNLFIDIVNYVDDGDNKSLSFDIRNGKMCRFFNTDNVKVPNRFYSVLNIIDDITSDTSDDDIIFLLDAALRGIAGGHDINIRKDPNNPNTMLPFPFVLPNTNL